MSFSDIGFILSGWTLGAFLTIYLDDTLFHDNPYFKDRPSLTTRLEFNIRLWLLWPIYVIALYWYTLWLLIRVFSKKKK